MAFDKTHWSVIEYKQYANGKVYTFYRQNGVVRLIEIEPFEEDGFEGYWYINENGQRAHTWDFEESIGE